MSTSRKPQLTRERIHETLWNLTAQHLDRDVATLKPEHRLITDLGADSLGVVELTMALEEKLGINLPEELMEDPDVTLGQIEEAICRKYL